MEPGTSIRIRLAEEQEDIMSTKIHSNYRFAVLALLVFAVFASYASLEAIGYFRPIAIFIAASCLGLGLYFGGGSFYLALRRDIYRATHGYIVEDNDETQGSTAEKSDGNLH